MPSDDPVKVATVKSLFEDYANSDVGLRSLADRLNARGVAGPTGGQWYAASIKAILENRNYTGTFTWAKRREGKYHSVTAGTVRERDRAEVRLSSAGKPLAVDNPREAWIVVENAHEPLIEKALFERVQARLFARRRGQPGIGYRTNTKKNDDAYLLSGLVFCARCGCKMHGSTLKRRKGETEYRYPKYICSTYCRSGRNNPQGCGYHAVNQELLVEILDRNLEESLFSEDSVKRIRSKLTRLLDERREGGQASTDAIKRQIADLDREIDRATENFLRAPSEILELVGQKLTTLKRQRDHARDQLRSIEAASGPTTVMDETELVVARLGRIKSDMENAEPARRREAYRELIDKIELRFEKTPRGKRTECPLQSGVIHLRTGEGGLFGCVSRGVRI